MTRVDLWLGRTFSSCLPSLSIDYENPWWKEKNDNKYCGSIFYYGRWRLSFVLHRNIRYEILFLAGSTRLGRYFTLRMNLSKGVCMAEMANWTRWLVPSRPVDRDEKSMFSKPQCGFLTLLMFRQQIRKLWEISKCHWFFDLFLRNAFDFSVLLFAFFRLSIFCHVPWQSRPVCHLWCTAKP